MPLELFAKATGFLLLAMPLVVLIAALPPARRGPQAALIYRQRMARATFITLVLALLAGLMFALGSRDAVVLPTFSIPGWVQGMTLPLSIAVNGMTLLLAALVSFVLMIIARFSIEYLAFLIFSAFLASCSKVA